jgi:hypothetical protein
MDGWMDRWMDGWMDGRTDGRMDGRMDGQGDRQLGRQAGMQAYSNIDTFQQCGCNKQSLFMITCRLNGKKRLETI